MGKHFLEIICACFLCSFPIVEPAPGHTKLQLSREGLEAISRITTPISAVAVIGPYRSGKSFLLNQLLSLSCYEGFGVGHMRDTKTKGIWVWGTPLELEIDGVKTSVIYLDTEGFESVGKSNVYDDRIFALATVMSSVLIYNLPETVSCPTSLFAQIAYASRYIILIIKESKSLQGFLYININYQVISKTKDQSVFEDLGSSDLGSSYGIKQSLVMFS
uniref:Putative guanylate binding protein n=1 Tax=Arabidopsis thaliana TaxID=3702 RepID=Q8S8C8_ARATH|nr:putative guanylate binding protein [Arabidopsis thaliana]